MNEVRRALEGLPDDALVPVWWVRQTIAGGQGTAFDGIGTSEASAITGIAARKLRRRHRTWERESERGQRPVIRVSRKSESDRSDLLFDRTDCYTYRRNQGDDGIR